MEFNREQIVKALECMLGFHSPIDPYETIDCHGCAFETNELCCENCSNGIATAALALIKELTEENKDLREQFHILDMECERLEKSEWELTEENERLRNSNAGFALAHLFDASPNADCWDEVIKQVKADTVKKMQDKLKKAFANIMIIRDVHNNEPNMDSDDVWDAIDQVVKELLEEKNDV